MSGARHPRTFSAIGVQRVTFKSSVRLIKIVGTEAIRNPERVERACRAFPGSIVVGIDASGNAMLAMWDGLSWSSMAIAGTVSETYWYGAEVAYEQQSGDAVVVSSLASSVEWIRDGVSGLVVAPRDADLWLPETYVLSGTWDTAIPSSAGMLFHPEGIDLTADGRVVVAERGNHLVSVWGALGEAQGRWGERGPGPGAAQADRSSRVESRRTDLLYVPAVAAVTASGAGPRRSAG